MLIPVKCNTVDDFESLCRHSNLPNHVITQSKDQIYPCIVRLEVDDSSKVCQMSIVLPPDKQSGVDYVDFGPKAIEMIKGECLMRFNAGKPNYALVDMAGLRHMFKAPLRGDTPKEGYGYNVVMDCYAELLRSQNKDTLGNLMVVLFSYGKTQSSDCYDTPDNLSWESFDYDVLEHVIAVLQYGADKYSRSNWKRSANTDELLDSLGRHIKKSLFSKFDDGKGGSGLYHFAHAICNLMFIIYHFDMKKTVE